MTAEPPSEKDAIRALLRGSHHLPADRLGAVVDARAAMLGAREAVVHLADYEQHSLVPVQGDASPVRSPGGVEGSVGARAFRRVRLVRSGSDRIWTPLLEGAERLGVMEIVFDGEVSADLEDDCRTPCLLGRRDHRHPRRLHRRLRPAPADPADGAGRRDPVGAAPAAHLRHARRRHLRRAGAVLRDRRGHLRLRGQRPDGPIVLVEWRSGREEQLKL